MKFTSCRKCYSVLHIAQSIFINPFLGGVKYEVAFFSIFIEVFIQYVDSTLFSDIIDYAYVMFDFCITRENNLLCIEGRSGFWGTLVL